MAPDTLTVLGAFLFQIFDFGLTMGERPKTDDG
jgi:hypothetical protein